MPADESDRVLVERIRAGDAAAWEECIARYEGRLLAFVESRLRNRATSEDVVQDTFLGFVISLPNYDSATPLESYLFSIAAHKMIDLLRREGRRPTLPLFTADDSRGGAEPAGKQRKASSLVRSGERRDTEAEVIAHCMQSLITEWTERAEFERLKCIELLFVLGWTNKNVAARLDVSEQAVANHKHYVITKLGKMIRNELGRDSDLLGDIA